MKFEVKWFGFRAEMAADAAGRAASPKAGERVLAAAQQAVPLLSGALRDSGRVDADGSEATVSYDTKYAAILHSHPEWNFRNGRDGQWLAHAAEQSADEVHGTYAAELRERL